MGDIDTFEVSSGFLVSWQNSSSTLSMILFLHGSDGDAVRAKVAEVLTAFKKKDPQSLNLAVFEGDAAAKDIRSASDAMPFLAESRLVIVKRFLAEAKKEEQEVVLDWLSEKAFSATTILLFAEFSKPDRRGRLFTWLSKNAKAQAFDVPEAGSGLAGLARQLAQEGNVSLEPAASSELLLRVGVDPVRLRTEIAKLALYVQGDNRKSVTRADVELQVVPVVDDAIFLLTDALARRDRAVALRLLHRQLSKGASAEYIHAMLVFQIRALLLVADGVSRGVPEAQLAKESGLHPYAAHKASQAVQRLPLERLRAAHDALYRMDRAMKRSQIDPVLALDLFVTSAAA